MLIHTTLKGRDHDKFIIVKKKKKFENLGFEGDVDSPACPTAPARKSFSLFLMPDGNRKAFHIL